MSMYYTVVSDRLRIADVIPSETEEEARNVHMKACEKYGMLPRWPRQVDGQAADAFVETLKAETVDPYWPSKPGSHYCRPLGRRRSSMCGQQRPPA